MGTKRLNIIEALRLNHERIGRAKGHPKGVAGKYLYPFTKIVKAWAGLYQTGAVKPVRKHCCTLPGTNQPASSSPTFELLRDKQAAIHEEKAYRHILWRSYCHQ